MHIYIWKKKIKINPLEIFYLILNFTSNNFKRIYLWFICLRNNTFYLYLRF